MIRSFCLVLWIRTLISICCSREDEFESRIAGKGYMQSLRGGGGIIETVRRTRYAIPDELYSTGYKRLTQALLNGTTTIEVKTGYGLDLAGEEKLLRVIKSLRKSHISNIIGSFLELTLSHRNIQQLTIIPVFSCGFFCRWHVR